MRGIGAAVVTVIVLNNAFYVTAAILVVLSIHLRLHQTTQSEGPVWGGPDVNAALNLNAGATVRLTSTQVFSRNRRNVSAQRSATREYSVIYRLRGEAGWSFTKPPLIMSDGHLIRAMSRGQWAGYRGVSQSRLKLLSQISPVENRPWRRDAGG